MTNYDKIKNMSTEDMAKFFTEFGNYCGNQCTYDPARCLDGTCKKRITQWLNQEVKPTLLEAERVILENIDKDYKWIARDSSGMLCGHKNKPQKRERTWLQAGYTYLDAFNHLFQFITWQDDEPYNIEELLKGE